MLTTTVKYCEHFLDTKRIFLDSCILIEASHSVDAQKIIEKAVEKYAVFFCTVSMLEVGFSTSEKITDEEKQWVSLIFSNERSTHVTNSDLSLLTISKVGTSPGFYSYNPNQMEWYAARHQLLKAQDLLKFEKKKREALMFDAIIYSSCWNSSSAMITNNIKDFEIFNKVHTTNWKNDRMMPIFNLRDLALSFDTDVSYPKLTS